MSGRNLGTRGKIQKQTGTWLKGSLGPPPAGILDPRNISPQTSHLFPFTFSALLTEGSSLYPSLFFRTFPLR